MTNPASPLECAALSNGIALAFAAVVPDWRILLIQGAFTLASAALAAWLKKHPTLPPGYVLERKPSRRKRARKPRPIKAGKPSQP